jgi:phage tail sheath protein FI
VHKAPANEPVLGCVDLEDGVDAARQRPLNQAGINCIRAFPGRGIRVWGARTVSKSAWPYLNVRRVVLTTARWAARALHDVAFEPSAPEVWARVTRLVATYLQSLYQQGAFIGATPDEAFSVACDATTNTPELRALGRLAVSVTLNAGPPSEIVLLRLVRDETGVTIQSSSSPG